MPTSECGIPENSPTTRARFAATSSSRLVLKARSGFARSAWAAAIASLTVGVPRTNFSRTRANPQANAEALSVFCVTRTAVSTQGSKAGSPAKRATRGATLQQPSTWPSQTVVEYHCAVLSGGAGVRVGDVPHKMCFRMLPFTNFSRDSMSNVFRPVHRWNRNLGTSSFRRRSS